jgi:hypothetical protein
MIPNNAIRYNSADLSAITPIKVKLMGPTIRAINAHFVRHNLTGYICCQAAIAATHGVRVLTSDPSVTKLLFKPGTEFKGKSVFSIKRVTDSKIISRHNIFVRYIPRIGDALDPIQTTTNPGLTDYKCPMSQLFDVETLKPYAICGYSVSMNTWTPAMLASNPVTEVTLSYSVLKDGPPNPKDKKAFTAWQGVALNTYKHIVDVFPWTVAAPGFGATVVTQLTHVCAVTGCRIEIHTSTPAPRFTSQTGGGFDGFSMIGEFTIGTTVLANQIRTPTTQPANLTTADTGFTPNPLFCMWYTTYVFELLDTTAVVTANGFADGTANFYGSFWDYSSVWAQGWQPPTPSIAASHQYQLKLTFYDPAEHDVVSSATMTLNPNDPNIIDFKVNVIKGLAVVTYPSRPVLFPRFTIKRSGDTTSEFTLSGEAPVGVEYSVGSFSSAGVYTGRINMSALIHDEYAPIYNEVLQIGATLTIRVRPPYFEGGQTPGGAWITGDSFSSPLEKTFTLTPRYEAVNINCTMLTTGEPASFSRLLDAHMLCIFDLDTTSARLIPRLSVNSTVTVGNSRDIKTSRLVYTEDFSSNCTTHNISNTIYNHTRCTIEFSHEFDTDAVAFTPQIFTQNIVSGKISRFDVGLFPIALIPNVIQHEVTINASVVVLKNFDTLLEPFQLTTPVSQLTTQTVTVNPGFMVTLQYLPDKTELTLKFTESDPNVTKVGTGVYTISLHRGLGYTELINRTSVVVTVAVPWWTGSAWNFPNGTPLNWPRLSTVLQIRIEAEDAALVIPVTTPVPGAIPEGTLFVSSRLGGTQITLLATTVAVAFVFVFINIQK